MREEYMAPFRCSICNSILKNIDDNFYECLDCTTIFKYDPINEEFIIVNTDPTISGN